MLPDPPFVCFRENFLVDFVGYTGVFAVVGPVLGFPDCRVPFFDFVFPVDMVVSVHAGEKIQTLPNI